MLGVSQDITDDFNSFPLVMLVVDRISGFFRSRCICYIGETYESVALDK
jgi:hypothetical protein